MFNKLALAGAFTILSTLSANALSLSVVAADCDPNASNMPGASAMIACSNDTNRNDSSAINLGAADGNFFSLGLSTDTTQTYGGGVLLRIDPAFTGPAMIVEVTTPSNHIEAAEVFVSNSTDRSSFQSVGYVNNGYGGNVAAQNTLQISGNWTYIAFFDVSRQEGANIGGLNGTASVDGFDLDSITVTAVPLPAGALLLGTAIGALLMRRRTA